MAAVALSLAACGGDDDGGAGPDVAVRDYYAALLAGDGSRACELLTEPLRRDISASRGTRLAGGECSDVLALAVGLNPDREGDDLAGLAVDVSVAGESGRARLTNPLTGKRETLRVERVGGEWRIASLELRPTR